MPTTPVRWKLHIQADHPPTKEDLSTIAEAIRWGDTEGGFDRFAPGHVTELMPLGAIDIGQIEASGQIGSAWQRRFLRPCDREEFSEADGLNRVAAVTVYLVRDQDEPTSLHFKRHILYAVADGGTYRDDNLLRLSSGAIDQSITWLRKATEDDAVTADLNCKQLCDAFDPTSLDWSRPHVVDPTSDQQPLLIADYNQEW